MTEQLVSVVVPAYNAEATIDETLWSVRHQSHRNLEIIVVDDGSTDRTALIALEHSREDPRLILIRQANAGVAAARNTGINASTSEYIAPIDADDIWHPLKIELQLKVMEVAGPKCGLVYSPCRIIDPDSRVVLTQEPHLCTGRVLWQLICYNVIRNGSAILVRRTAALNAGGYDSSLFRNNAQGCEDILFAATVASKYHVDVAPQYLIGYRLTKNSMSRNAEKMYRSHLLALKRLDEVVQGVSPFLFRWSATTPRFNYGVVELATAGKGHLGMLRMFTAFVLDPYGYLMALQQAIPSVRRRVSLWATSSGQNSLGKWIQTLVEQQPDPQVGKVFCKVGLDEGFTQNIKSFTYRRLNYLRKKDASDCRKLYP